MLDFCITNDHFLQFANSSFLLLLFLTSAISSSHADSLAYWNSCSIEVQVGSDDKRECWNPGMICKLHTSSLVGFWPIFHWLSFVERSSSNHCFWHKLPFLTMCEKSWHELSWHLTHLLRSSKNSVEIESARKETIEYKFHLILGDYFQHALSLHQMYRKISPC